jgi:hypothetical protein
MANTELLKQTMELVAANPDHWDQRQVHCGSSHCFLGFSQCIVNEVSIYRKNS